jgi:hypothetical protein
MSLGPFKESPSDVLNGVKTTLAGLYVALYKRSLPKLGLKNRSYKNRNMEVAKLLKELHAGLPDGVFSYQKYHFG